MKSLVSIAQICSVEFFQIALANEGQKGMSQAFSCVVGRGLC